MTGVARTRARPGARARGVGREINYKSSSSPYVSYIDQIDDAEVLAAINKLNRRKKGVSSPRTTTRTSRNTSTSNSSISSTSTSSSNACKWNQGKQVNTKMTTEVDMQNNQSSSLSSAFWGKIFSRRGNDDGATAARTVDAGSPTASASFGSSPAKGDATESTKASSSKSTGSVAASMANSILDLKASLSNTSDASDTSDTSNSSGVNKNDDPNDSSEEQTKTKVERTWDTLTCSAFSDKQINDKQVDGLDLDGIKDGLNHKHEQTRSLKNRRLLPKELTVYFTAVKYMVNKLIKEDETIMNRSSHKVQRILLYPEQEMASTNRRRSNRGKKSVNSSTVDSKMQVPVKTEQEGGEGHPVSPSTQLTAEDYDDNSTLFDDEDGVGDADIDDHEEETHIGSFYDEGVPMISSMFSCSCSPINESRPKHKLKSNDDSLQKSPSMIPPDKKLLDDLDDADSDNDDYDANGDASDVRCIILPGKDGKFRLLAEI